MTKQISDGSVIDAGFDVDPRDQQLEALRAENRRLQRAVSDAELKAERAHEDANRALSMLRKQLGPLYRALQAVFGELDEAGVRDDGPSASAAPSAASSGTAPAVDARTATVYTSWKQRLGPAAAKIIDALLLHGEMNATQLAIAAPMHRTNVPKVIYKLNQAGLINKNGNKVSLKALP